MRDYRRAVLDRVLPEEFGSASLLQPFFASMPEGEHSGAVRELARALAEIFERRNASVPAWVRAAACPSQAGEPHVTGPVEQRHVDRDGTAGAA